jgi:hypothetical protein
VNGVFHKDRQTQLPGTFCCWAFGNRRHLIRTTLPECGHLPDRTAAVENAVRS